ncbi:hypothetical protein UFOVP328_402 [uncultured Caudovirales phage]|uniref:Uncharacterized protein n=1 Tax=uncultured Caudovirales phage TaxID=2100421 RepID=A0A6J5M2R6_9CAUD|nr:hypothetical protein UFOVP328_402 [uncultured Caudovirales phage]
MKIGFSYSRCIRDIVDGKVDINDVLVIIARTNFDPHNDEQWEEIWKGYRTRFGFSQPEWIDYPDSAQDRFRQISIDLWDLGKLHQPRRFGTNYPRAQEIWVDTEPMSLDRFDDPAAVKEAWTNYKLLRTLTVND